jgi:hypothetical protein
MAVSRQGSNTGAIIFAVVSTVAAVVAIVVAIMTYVRAGNLQAELDRQTDEVTPVISPANVNSPTVTAFRDLQTEDDALPSNVALIDTAKRAVDLLGETITGDAGISPSNARVQLETAVESAVESARVIDPEVNPVPASNAVAAINALAQELNAALNAKASTEQALEEALARTQQLQTQTATQLAERDKAVEEAQQMAEAARQELDTARASSEQVVSTITGESQQRSENFDREAESLEAEIRDQRSQIARLQAQIDILEAQVPKIDPTMQIAQLADGRVQEVAGSGNVYINLGEGDAITPGMTFQVFGRNDGVPDPGDFEGGELIQGKAEIQVIRVSPGSSEARIVTQTGQPVQGGDLIVNLAYDANKSPQFYTFGSFDLDRDGRVSPGDIDIVRQLIRQWGGENSNRLKVDTDFVVLGAEPEIPANLDPDNPLDQIEIERIRSLQQQYAEIVTEARELTIPILNQYQFLVMTGYYGQARR